jgi:hypothetical protein
MARCSYHPNVETELSCTQCGKPICPRDMVDTPVGYKCRECSRQPKSALVHVRPKQLAGAVGAAVLAGAGGGAILGWIGFGFFFVGFIWGALVGEATRRGSGGHRGTIVAIIAAVGVGFGWVAGNVIGYVSPFTALIAAVVAFGLLARDWR